MKKKLPVLIILFFTTGLFNVKGQNWNQFNTNHGYIKLGPNNQSWAHIYTNAPKFIFNKDVYSIGGFSSYNNYNLTLKTGGITRMLLKRSNGFVGIGTTNPLERLHVNGSILLPADKKLKFGTEYHNSGSLEIHNARNSYNTFADIKGNLYFRTEASQGTLGIQKDATVTIGVWPKYDNSITNTDGHKLMVNGGILCQKIKVIANVPNSDHVFEADYKLKSIYELKEFVKNNKHLPEIPSAKEFQENGYNIGDMDDLLLRKIEELTLYLIQLKEEIDTLKTENSKLKQVISE